jgi:hypothetical protein
VPSSTQNLTLPYYMTINYEAPQKGLNPIKNLSLQINKLGLKGLISDRLRLSLIFFMLTMFSENAIC